MSRGLGLISLLVSLALVGALFGLNARRSGPTSQSARTIESLAAEAGLIANFAQAAPQLELYHSANGTYVGAVLPPSFGVVLARADASSYCLQDDTHGRVEHETGPGGSLASGPC